jgi:quercetin dioxygenase-like cupin family protein
MYIFDLKEHGEALTFFGEPDPSAPYVDFECTIAPGKNGPDPHIHPKQTETFYVTGGQMRAVVNGEEKIVQAGETIVIEPGLVHSFSNAKQDEPKQSGFIFSASTLLRITDKYIIELC